MKHKIALIACTLLSSIFGLVAFGFARTELVTVDLSRRTSPVNWTWTADADSAVRVTVKSDGSDFDLREWGAYLFVGDANLATDIPGANASFNQITFDVTRQYLPTNGKYVVQIIATNTAGRVEEWARGNVTVRANPAIEAMPATWNGYVDLAARIAPLITRQLVIEEVSNATNAMVQAIIISTGAVTPSVVTNAAGAVTSNIVTKSFVEGLGISGGGADTNAVNDLIRSYDETNLTARINAKVDRANAVVSNTVKIVSDFSTETILSYGETEGSQTAVIQGNMTGFTFCGTVARAAKADEADSLSFTPEYATESGSVRGDSSRIATTGHKMTCDEWPSGSWKGRWGDYYNNTFSPFAMQSDTYTKAEIDAMPRDFITDGTNIITASRKFVVKATPWTILRDDVDVTSQVPQPMFELLPPPPYTKAWTVGNSVISGDTSISEYNYGDENKTSLAWDAITSGSEPQIHYYTATREIFVTNTLATVAEVSTAKNVAVTTAKDYADATFLNKNDSTIVHKDVITIYGNNKASILGNGSDTGCGTAIILSSGGPVATIGHHSDNEGSYYGFTWYYWYQYRKYPVISICDYDEKPYFMSYSNDVVFNFGDSDYHNRSELKVDGSPVATSNMVERVIASKPAPSPLTGHTYNFDNGSNFTMRVYAALTNVIQTLGGTVTNPPNFN